MNRPFTLSDILDAKAVLSGVEAADKKQMISFLADHAAPLFGVEAHVLNDVLWEREKLGTTGVGHGIAIPHGRVAGLTAVHGFFARLASPIPFDANDDKPVDLVFLLLAPEDAGADHLHALAAVSRALRDPELCAKLRAAKDKTALYKLLCTATTAEAA
ncbi:MAG: PTS sugar transporter subunit IIA [Alphaproteobacteria bacterium]|nr:PTS sugar transporter subunit IIA [Alphaproteobacteria bacterium]